MVAGNIYNIYNRSKTDTNWQNFEKQRNICTSLKRKAKITYFKKKTESQESFWKIFGPYLSNKGLHSPEDYMIINDGELITDKKNIGNVVNDYYINILEKTTGKQCETFDLNAEGKPVDQIIEHYKNHPSILLIKDKIIENTDLETFEMQRNGYL